MSFAFNVIFNVFRFSSTISGNTSFDPVSLLCHLSILSIPFCSVMLMCHFV